MNGLEIIRAALRHLVVVACCLLLTILAAAAVYVTAPKNFVATAQFILIGPNRPLAGNGKAVSVNPLAGAGDNAAQVIASALVVLSQSDLFAARFDKNKITSSYAVAVSPTGGGVVLVVTATNKQGPLAGKDLPTVVNQLKEALSAKQAETGAPPPSFYTLSPLTGNGGAEPASGSKTKLAAVVLALGLILTIMAALIADARSRRRANRPRPSGPAHPPRPIPGR